MTAGEIAYDELNKALRSGGKVQLDANLQAGAAGTIETKAVNKSKRDSSPGKQNIKKGGNAVIAQNRMAKGGKSPRKSGGPSGGGSGGGGGGGGGGGKKTMTWDEVQSEEFQPEDEVNEEDFEMEFAAGIRQAANDYQAHDVNNDQKLDFEEFCALVREREEGDFSDEELQKRFEALDADGSGKVRRVTMRYARYIRRAPHLLNTPLRSLRP